MWTAFEPLIGSQLFSFKAKDGRIPGFPSQMSMVTVCLVANLWPKRMVEEELARAIPQAHHRPTLGCWTQQVRINTKATCENTKPREAPLQRFEPSGQGLRLFVGIFERPLLRVFTWS